MIAPADHLVLSHFAVFKGPSRSKSSSCETTYAFWLVVTNALATVPHPILANMFPESGEAPKQKCSITSEIEKDHDENKLLVELMA